LFRVAVSRIFGPIRWCFSNERKIFEVLRAVFVPLILTIIYYFMWKNLPNISVSWVPFAWECCV
jgi:hypothetical protein